MEKENKDFDENLEQDVVSEETTEQVEEGSENQVSDENAEKADEVNEAQDASEKEETSDNDKSDKKKKRGFKKKDKRDEQLEELNDKYQRLFAEFQNFRSRSEKEKAAMFETGAKSIIEKILPIVDNFERGVAALSEEDLESPVGQGMNLIYKQLLSTLEEMGVTAIEAEGKEFDPEFHNAVMHEDNDELGENVVSQELQKGYKYRDTVIRHSMVKVAN